MIMNIPYTVYDIDGLGEGYEMVQVGLQDLTTIDATPVGLNSRWDDKKGDCGAADLFPDLIGLQVDSDDISTDSWINSPGIHSLLEANDLREDHVQVYSPDIITNSWLEDMDICSLLDVNGRATQTDESHTRTEEISELIPIESVDISVETSEQNTMSESYLDHFDHDRIETIMAKPLSPIDVTRALDEPTEIASTLYYDVRSRDRTSNSPGEAAVLIDITQKNLPLSVIDMVTTNGVDEPFDCASDDPDSDPDYVPTTKAASSTATSSSGKRASKSSRRRRGNGSREADTAFGVSAAKINRKERKKVQNKDAATRYRVKKREENRFIKDEEAVLEAANKELNEKVLKLRQEIAYMRDLMADVFKASGEHELAQRVLGCK